MDVTEFKDWQFGRFYWDDGYYKAEVVWTLEITIELWLRILSNDAADLNMIIERARNIFNSLRDRKDEFPSLAARDLLDAWNELIDDTEHQVDAQHIIDIMELNLIQILPNGESMLTYVTYGIRWPTLSRQFFDLV